MPAAVSGRLHVPVFAFPIIKIITWGQLCQQLVKPVTRTYFHFFARKNRNAGAAMLGAGMPAVLSSRPHVLVFAFPLVKIITRGQLCQQLVRPVARMCFHFSACKNRNAGAAMPTADESAVV